MNLPSAGLLAADARLGDYAVSDDGMTLVAAVPGIMRGTTTNRVRSRRPGKEPPFTPEEARRTAQQITADRIAAQQTLERQRRREALLIGGPVVTALVVVGGALGAAWWQHVRHT